MAKTPSYAAIKGLSYNQLASGYMSGKYSEKELRSMYSDIRHIAQNQIRRIERSSAPFLAGEKPYFSKTANLITTSDVLHAIADVNRFMKSPTYSKPAREARLRTVTKTLSNQGFEVTGKNIKRFGEFMQWFKASAYAALYDSDAEEVKDVFNNSGRGRSRTWSKLFKEYAAE